MTMETAKARGSRKQRNGTVISISGDKSVVVSVETRKRHPLYGKVLRTHAKFHAHDESNKARVGDKVVIAESRPFSKLKRWRVVEVTSTATA